MFEGGRKNTFLYFSQNCNFAFLLLTPFIEYEINKLWRYSPKIFGTENS